MKQMLTIDANEAVARVAHKTNEVIAIYPITPSTPMAELSDIYSSRGERNIFGGLPEIMEMQSEGGASGAVHGSLQTGALTTTFTASQGLLLMIPNMYKIAGELTPTVFHVAARAIATQALSIFGDHSDVMAVRQTGFALFSSVNVQEAHDFALIAQDTTLRTRIPFLHFFDGFRTSHEVSKIEILDIETIKAMIDEDLVHAHRNRSLSSDRPVIRGTSQNPDVYFQGRESSNIYYEKLPDILQESMDKFSKLTGRSYKLFDYYGAKDATKIIILMGSSCDTVEETVDYLLEQDEKVGVLKVRLYRPFSVKHFLAVLPKTTKSIAVLDRTKESGSLGEPLYLDIVSALSELDSDGALGFDMPHIIGGRYGLSSKEFTPSMVIAVFNELDKEKPKNHFTIGIHDDVTHTSLEWDSTFTLASKDVFRGMFFGLGSDGTVGANKNSIKIIGTQTPNYAQGYFVYDSNKSGSMTTSHLRFGKEPIKSSYLIEKANFIACHQSVFLEKFDILRNAEQGATFLLNSPFSKDIVFSKLPLRVQEEIIEKELKFYVIDATKVSLKSNMGRRINTVMQTCFFAISNILPKEEAIEKIKNSIEKSYSSKGKKIVEMNYIAVDNTLENLFEVTVPKETIGQKAMQPLVQGDFDKFVEEVTAKIISGDGDSLPVSAIPDDGTWQTGTSQYQKRSIALEVPIWDPDTCIQCNKCVLVCPHAAIRSKVIDETILTDLPDNFLFTKAKGKTFEESEMFTIQVAVEDCTGCTLCVEVCPAKNKSQTNLKAINMSPQEPIRESGAQTWDYFTKLPAYDRSKLNHEKVKETQFLEPLFEFSGACPGCGETPYVKLASQLFGDRMIIANATGCSSIYGGNLPTTPWRKNEDGRGPAWSNSLFEDNAEFGLGFRLAIDKHTHNARETLSALSGIPDELKESILNAEQKDEPDIFAQRQRVKELKDVLKDAKGDEANRLRELSDYLVKKSVWMMGGDGWAYDIGYGGVDHVLASGKNVNILVLDTQVYSNTGGQQSKATMTGAIAKFAANGKAQIPKDLAMMAVSYGNVYVARVAMGASDAQTVKAFVEAEAYDGPSIIIAYSHCVAHGYDLRYGMAHQKLAVDCGLWATFRYNPDLEKEGKNPMILDYKGPQIDVKNFMYQETRFKMVEKLDENNAKEYLETARHHAKDMYKRYQTLEQSFAKVEEN
ncbi:pyruvate:ferredoxin (flavodoxin) oxidoreductase [Sulfurimonas aquatica]|uniref:Pyruvate:ferredoxin (Flavodoxin) oxidoreductase n=1 Tax=Sulfurimonas aquatica TaxID=2672570 RepID=A0A975B1U3_9BACT|nr:pyruvate:ferredoxin (flavodoxin) oxidoreductase [Sulfurimonas aquatica]QSZ42672.1 pyruvate:ferredoxin (flavodoxin) oxidoreductase [Sulfurimonas aquatica]